MTNTGWPQDVSCLPNTTNGSENHGVETPECCSSRPRQSLPSSTHQHTQPSQLLPKNSNCTHLLQLTSLLSLTQFTDMIIQTPETKHQSSFRWSNYPKREVSPHGRLPPHPAAGEHESSQPAATLLCMSHIWQPVPSSHKHHCQWVTTRLPLDLLVFISALLMELRKLGKLYWHRRFN